MSNYASAAAGRCLGAFIFHTGSPSTRVPSARRATEKRDRRRGRQDWIFEGVLFWRAAAYSTLGWLLALDGRPAEGLPYLASGAALQAEAGISGTLAVFWHRWAGGVLEAGQLKEAGRTAHRALELAQAAGESA
jgi:hypothetical protein